MVIGKANLVQDAKGIALMTKQGAKNELYYSGEISQDKQSMVTEVLESDLTPK